MFILDDLLISPILWVFKEINNAVQKEITGEAETITRALSDLYIKVESGAITEELFAIEETKLLDRLDEIEASQIDPDDD
ncbi:MAG: gas vesicle protein GvpG [Planctomycetota bacterium]|nr:gas vesicle protein GvpG [Planctomycetota bacterium]